MATRDELAAAAIRELKEELKKEISALGVKFDGGNKELNDFKIQCGKELNEFKIQYAGEMATIRTQVKIYASIAASIGMAAGALLSKYVR